MMVPKYVELWVADSDGAAVAGPIFGEMRWSVKDNGQVAVAPTRGVVIDVPEGYIHPLNIQAYDLDDDETLLGEWPLWLNFPRGGSLSMQPWYHLVDDKPRTYPLQQCCCRWGAAVRGEWPEFECSFCPKHGEDDAIPSCKRHLKQYHEQMGVKR